MHLSRRHLEPGEIDHELIWLSVSLASFGVGAFWFRSDWPWPRCAFHDLTGWPCITCGATRAAIQFFHGNFLRALEWNPLVFLGLCGLFIFDIYALSVLMTGRPRVRITSVTTKEKIWVRAFGIAALLLNWAYLLGHWHNFS